MAEKRENTSYITLQIQSIFSHRYENNIIFS